MKTKKITRLGALIALGVTFHIIESFLPPLPVPGAKLGLANVVTIFTLVFFGFRESLIVVIMRCLLASLLRGSFLGVGFYLSLGGGIISCLAMGAVYLVFKKSVSLVGIGIIGAVFHNLTQIIIAYFFIGSLGIFLYLPFTLLFALPTGFFTGYLSYLAWQQLGNVLKEEQA